MKYITAEELIERVKLIIPFFFESGLMDEAILLNEISKSVQSLGDRIYPNKSATIELKDGKAHLPDDFRNEILVYLTNCYRQSGPTTGLITYETRVCEIPACHNPCEYFTDQKGLYQIYQRDKRDFYVHKDLVCLTTNDCENYKSHKDYEIINNCLISSKYKSGSIYLEYKADTDLLVPDYPEILDWLEASLISFTMKRLWYNLEDNTYQRMQFAIQDEQVKRMKAINFWRRREFCDFKNLREYLVKRNSKLAHGR